MEINKIFGGENPITPVRVSVCEVTGATHGYSPRHYDLEGDNFAFVPVNLLFVTYVLTGKTGRDYDSMFSETLINYESWAKKCS